LKLNLQPDEVKKDFCFKRAQLKKTKALFSRPQQPLTAYSLFLREQLNINPLPADSKLIKERFKEVSEKWKSLSESEKEVYRKRANVLSDEYQKALIKWEMRMLKEGHVDLVRKQTIESREKVEKMK